MLRAQILNLLIDGPNILIDLLLIPQALSQRLGDKLINWMILAVDLPQRLHLTGDLVNMADAEMVRRL